MKTKTRTKAISLDPMDDLRVRVGDARRALVGLGAQGLSQIEKHPLGAVAGAFATGMVVAKLIGRS